MAVALVLAPIGGIEGQSLGGSRASLDRQGAQAAAHDFTYLETPGDVRRFVNGGYLVPVVPNQDLDLHDVSYPYARPEARLFVERLAAQYRSACGEKLVVTSLTRPLSDQPWNASDQSVHPTGMAIDLRRSNRSACRNWLESTILSLEGRGVLEATRERRPPHYHVAIFPTQYRAYVSRITGRAVVLAGASGAEPGPGDEGWVTHVVQRGESLSRIASRYGVGLGRMRAANGIQGDRLLVGQRLRVPVPGQPSASTRVAEAPRDTDPEPPRDAAPAAPAASAPGPEAPASVGVSHRVSRGESLWTIARLYGVEEVALRRANAITGSRILPGQELSIPSGPSGAYAGSFEHTVRRGESLWTIARDYRIRQDELRAANGLRGSRILVGQVLTIPGEGAGG